MFENKSELSCLINLADSEVGLVKYLVKTALRSEVEFRYWIRNIENLALLTWKSSLQVYCSWFGIFYSVTCVRVSSFMFTVTNLRPPPWSCWIFSLFFLISKKQDESFNIGTSNKLIMTVNIFVYDLVFYIGRYYFIFIAYTIIRMLWLLQWNMEKKNEIK